MIKGIIIITPNPNNAFMSVSIDFPPVDTLDT